MGRSDRNFTCSKPTFIFVGTHILLRTVQKIVTLMDDLNNVRAHSTYVALEGTLAICTFTFDLLILVALHLDVQKS